MWRKNKSAYIKVKEAGKRLWWWDKDMWSHCECLWEGTKAKTGNDLAKKYTYDVRELIRVVSLWCNVDNEKEWKFCQVIQYHACLIRVVVSKSNVLWRSKENNFSKST